MNAGAKPTELKAKVKHELVEYAINVVYLTLVFASFTVYRRLVLAAHDIAYTHYGFAVIEALVLGKVIMVGGVFRLGRGLEDRPLIFPTLYKTVVFTVFCGLFKALEYGLKGLWRGEGFAQGIGGLASEGWEVLLGNALVVFVAFIPFFGVKEMGRVLGEKTIRTLFFQRRAAP